MKMFAFTCLTLLSGGLVPLLSTRAPAHAAESCCASAAAVPGAALDPIRALCGTWVQLDEQGQPTATVASRYALTAGGTAVIETLFPGTPHEMVSLYYCEGDALCLTHYCVLGNHPRMQAQRDAETGELVFRCAGEGLNFERCAAAHHMHEGRLRMLGADRLESTWTPWKEGRAEEAAHFALARQPER